LAELEMQMRPGGASRGADVADDLPLLDPGAGSDPFGVAAQMQVGGLIDRVVTDPDGLAPRAPSAREGHRALPDGSDRRTGRRGVVHAEMRTVGLENGMKALSREARRDT